jgi:hypothetical protein
VTLVLTCITRKFVFQVSDRRVTYIDRHGNGTLADDNRNKLTVVCNELVFGYSGLAELDGRHTDEWLSDLLHEIVPYDINKVLAGVREGAEGAIAAVSHRKELTRLAFVVGGWARRSATLPLEPFVWTISNALRDDWTWRDEGGSEFRVQAKHLANGEAVALVATGARVQRARYKAAYRALIRCEDHDAGPEAFLRVMAAVIRETATEDATVGQNLLAVVLPMAAAGRPAEMSAMLQLPLPRDLVSSLHLPSPNLRGAGYAPNLVCNGYRSSGVAIHAIRRDAQGAAPPWTAGTLILAAVKYKAGVISLADSFENEDVSTWQILAVCAAPIEGVTVPCVVLLPERDASSDLLKNRGIFVLSRYIGDAFQPMDAAFVRELVSEAEKLGVGRPDLDQLRTSVEHTPFRFGIVDYLLSRFRIDKTSG